MKLNDTLRFSFAGFSIWLDPEQFDSDLDNAIKVASKELGVYPIPAPHVTLVYGIGGLSQIEAMKRFRALFSSGGDVQNWSTLRHKGFVSDVELDGVNGGLMDMSWMEVTYENSPTHQSWLEFVRDWFKDGTNNAHLTGEWAPHASLAYANPELPIPLEFLVDLIQRFPTLKQNRRIVGVSLWSTKGTIDQWKCLDRIRFDDVDGVES